MAKDEYSWVTDTMFDDELEEILLGMDANQLVTLVPNILSEVREYFNNDVLVGLEKKRNEENEEGVEK